MNVGDDVEVKYRLSGRRWQKDPSSEVKFFLNAEAISFQVHDSSANSGPTEENSANVNDAFTDASNEEAPF
jgi:hypothetical protein